jgi:hypothetical protein
MFSTQELATVCENVATEMLKGTLLDVPKDAKPNPRTLPLDLIFTLNGSDTTCCIAVMAGLKYGLQSADFNLCPYTERMGERHKVTFVDNDYFHYDHAKHLEVVRRFRPKYCTVRDVMTEQQCLAGEITYYPLEQVLDWAAELAEYAENVIVIPKYDCLDQIPDRYMLGYSVPTSHGGTPLPVELFRGRRVHLLGGSWRAQLAHMAQLGDDVVSVDNNYIALIARYGQFVTPDGETASIQGLLPELVNPRNIALAISLGSMAKKVNELF